MENFDSTYMTQMSSAFLDELSSIEKRAFIGTGMRFVRSGGRKLWQAGQTLGKSGGGATMALGGRGAVRAGGIGKHMGQIYHGAGGGWGGAKALMRSRYGQMASVPMLAGGGIYAANRMMGGGQQPRGY